MDIVQEVLRKEQETLGKFKPIAVEKHLEVENDLGLLLCSDFNELDEAQLRSNQEEYLLQLTRDNTQLLLNDIWELPTERVEETVVAKLPAPKYRLPRARKVPEPKPMTKWQKFAQEKGIKKQKRDKKVFDKDLDKWVPTYGFQKAAATRDKDWVLEVPANADPMEDQFMKKTDMKNERVAKNEVQRLKNIARAQKVKMPRAGIMATESSSSKELLTAATIAKSSTASVGKFQGKLHKERLAKGLGVKELIPGVKRKASHLDPEKTQNLDLLHSILNKRPTLDEDKAVNMQRRDNRLAHEASQAEKNGDDDIHNRSKKKKGKARVKGLKKPKGGKGQRNPSKRPIGRKRR